MVSPNKDQSNVYAMVACGVLVLFVLVMLAISVVPGATHLSVPELRNKPVPIDSETFPDEAFRSYISTHIDQDGNDYLSMDEIASVKAIGRYDQETYAVTETGLANAGVHSLEGIDTFYNLESLVASGNDISEFDISGNRSLRYVDLRNSSSKVYIDFTSANAGAQILVSEGSESGGDSSELDFVVVED